MAGAAKSLHIRPLAALMPGVVSGVYRVDKVLMISARLQTHASVLPAERSGRSADRWRSLTSGMTATAYHQSVPVRTDGCGDSFRGSIYGHRCVNHAIHPHIATADAFVHFGVNVQRGEQRIERAGGGVHHKGLFMRLCGT